MITRKSTFFLGLFIFLVPFLGLPSFSKTALIILSGLILVALSVKIILPKRNLQQNEESRAEKEYTEHASVTLNKKTLNKIVKPRAKRKEKSVPIFVDNIIVSENIDKMPEIK